MGGKGVGKHNKKSAFEGISNTQNAFVKGRQILDAVLVANEAMDSVLRSNRGAILCGLRLGLRGTFLCFVMSKMGFGGDGLDGLNGASL